MEAEEFRNIQILWIHYSLAPGKFQKLHIK